MSFPIPPEFSARRDTVRIYENFFTHRGGDVFPLESVEKKSGETIAFEHTLPGTPEIVERFEAYRINRRKNRDRS